MKFATQENLLHMLATIALEKGYNVKELKILTGIYQSFLKFKDINTDKIIKAEFSDYSFYLVADKKAENYTSKWRGELLAKYDKEYSIALDTLLKRAAKANNLPIEKISNDASTL